MYIECYHCTKLYYTEKLFFLASMVMRQAGSAENTGLTWVGYANSVIRRGAALREKQSPTPTVDMISTETD
jgi:hypothetical protein